VYIPSQAGEPLPVDIECICMSCTRLCVYCAVIASSMAVADPKNARHLGAASLGVSVGGIILSIFIIIMMFSVVFSSPGHHWSIDSKYHPTTMPTRRVRCEFSTLYDIVCWILHVAVSYLETRLMTATQRCRVGNPSSVETPLHVDASCTVWAHEQTKI